MNTVSEGRKKHSKHTKGFNWKIFSLTPRKVIIALSLLCVSLMIALVVVIHYARQDAGTHYNLSYVLWKNGLKPYERSLALQGMTHDHRFRDNLKGISPSEFETIFPNTFYEVKTPPPSAIPGQRYFIDDYDQAQQAEGRFDQVWIAIFENDRLIDLYHYKDIP